MMKHTKKDCNCKTCNKKMTLNYFKKYDGNCMYCDMEINPQYWGSVEMFSV